MFGAAQRRDPAFGGRIRKDRVVSDMPATRKLPSAERRGHQGFTAIITPRETITAPRPWAKG